MRKVSRPPPSRSTLLTRTESARGIGPCVAVEGAPPAERSAPAQKPRPAPVTITTLTASSASVASKAAIMSSIIWLVKAFSLSGRFSVMVAMPSSTA